MDRIELRATRPDEIEAVCALVNRVDRHDGVPAVTSLDQLRQQLDVAYVDLALDSQVAVGDGRLVGWLWVDNPPAAARQERAVLFGYVDPDHRGQQIGRRLLGWGVERASQRFRQRTHGLPCYIRVYAYDWLEANHHLYRRYGFQPVRWFEELARPLDELPAVPALPDGVALMSWPDDRDAELRAVRDAAFADHWGSMPLDDDSWGSLVRGHSSRTDLSVVARHEASDAVVGLCLNHVYPEDHELTGRREAWIDNLATLRPWRGQGLASAMIAWSLAAFATDGLDHALIAVDSENPTGAAQLYRNLGFEPEHRVIAHEIEVA